MHGTVRSKKPLRSFISRIKSIEPLLVLKMIAEVIHPVMGSFQFGRIKR
jgi:hypothetical protein